MSTTEYQAWTAFTFMKYPPYVVCGLLDSGPAVWTFETAADVAKFMWGRGFSQYAIFKNRRLFCRETLSSDVKELEQLLEAY